MTNIVEQLFKSLDPWILGRGFILRGSRNEYPQ